MSAEPVAAKTRRAYCSVVSSQSGETLAATASRVDHWLLLEYRGAWEREPLAASTLAPELKEHLRVQLAALPRSRLLLVGKPGRYLQTGSRAFLGRSRPGAERLVELKLEHPHDLLGVDFAAALDGTGPGTEAVEKPLYAVCTHGKRDRCCALQGRPLYEALRHVTAPARVWQSTHVGGDRFAGNVVVLPHGLYYGRVRPDDVGRLVAATDAGQVELAHYRGRSAYPFSVQAAERTLREAERLLGIDDLGLVAVEQSRDGGRLVRFRTPDGAVHELAVVETLADVPAFLTCDSAELGRARRWVVTTHAVVSR
jgi:hypothetical protein